MPALLSLPNIIAHADWSASPSKRWLARAIQTEPGRYVAQAPEKVGETESLLRRMQESAGTSEAFLLGFDFPIGMPIHYARRCGIDDFLAVLPRLGQGEWGDFYQPASFPEQIKPQRPFYPQLPGQARQKHLLQGLDVQTMDDLRRQCERGYPGRRAAAPLFWTLGAQQVGKAAINGWRTILAPAQAGANPLAIWPFSGRLEELFQAGQSVAAETYPGEVYHHLGVKFPAGSGKRTLAGRVTNAGVLIEWANCSGVILTVELETKIRAGFGPAPAAEDAFDAVIGLFGMLNVVLGYQSLGEPVSGEIRRVEGWIFGQQS